MPKVARGIRRIPGFSNSYIVEEPGGKLTLVDCGFQANGQKILEEVAAMGRKPADVTTIILTHGHQDHSRGAASLKKATGARLAAHEAEVGYITKKVRYPPAKGGMRLVTALLGVFVRVRPSEVEIALTEGQRIGRLTVAHAPGHTPGSIVLVDQETNSLFSGDTIVSGRQGLVGPNARYTMDMEEAKRSIAKISGLTFGTVLPGRGDPLTAPEAPEQVARLAN